MVISINGLVKNMKETNIDSIIMPVLMVIAIIVLIIVITNDNGNDFDECRDKTLAETPQIDDPLDLNDDPYAEGYRKGWIDAIHRIDAYYHATDNTTLFSMMVH